MNAPAERNKVIWRFSDGRAGHDSQSKGLASALGALLGCDCYDLRLPVSLSGYGWGLLKKFPLARDLPDPDLLIGAGHATHLPMLLARYARGGRALVLMKPSLPAQLFDLCLIPEHDRVNSANNIIPTVGPLNLLRAGGQLSSDRGLILIGGESKHFVWDADHLLQQLKQIIEREDIYWTIADSPRTAASTRKHLQTLNNDRIDYIAYGDTNSPGLGDLLQQAATVWVSEDSMSMIYEALSTGAAVGVIRVPRKSRSRLTGVAQSLAEKRMLVLFDEWLSGQALAAPASALSESRRCALAISERFGWSAAKPV